MDLRDPKTQKWFLGALGAVLLIYFWHSKVYEPAESKIEMSYMRYEALQSQLKSVEMKFQSLDALKREYNDLTSRYRVVEQLLPEEDQVSPLLSKVHASALETSSRIESIEPQPPVSEGFYDRQDFKLVINSTFHDFGDFLARVANLPFIVNVNDVQMLNPSDLAMANRKDVDEGFTMMAALTLSTYKVKESERLMLADVDETALPETPGMDSQTNETGE
jgi:type IV pilus assembly protein PilO